MYNIKQITNFDIDSCPSIPKENMIIAGMSTPRTVIYKDITNSSIAQGIKKIGYCCEPKALHYPIFLGFNNGQAEQFQIGKTGMFEVQPEENKNEDDPGAQEEIIEIKITKVEVPWQWNQEPNPSEHGYKFKFDYICDIDN